MGFSGNKMTMHGWTGSWLFFASACGTVGLLAGDAHCFEAVCGLGFL